MTDTNAKVVGINGNMVTIEFDGNVSMNEVGYVNVDGKKLRGEIIRIRGNKAQMQIFEMTQGIKAGDKVELMGDLLCAELGPGLLGQTFDGLQNPLPLVAEKAGFFLERGVYVDSLPRDKKWEWTPTAKPGDKVVRGDFVGTVPEGPFTHKILVPFDMLGMYTVKEVTPAGSYTIMDKMAVVTDEKGNPLKIQSTATQLRPIIANIDKLFIVSSYTTPKPDAVMIDRLTATCVFNNIEPIIVFNKCDMGSFDDWVKIYKNSGFKTYVVSALTNDGIEDIKNEVRNCISAFAGNSGVGKSSILNAVFSDLMLKTGEVSDKLGRGRHTTRHTQLFKNNYGGYVADTPGFSSIDIQNNTYEFKTHLTECFPDINKFVGNCKFTSCTHICEKGCKVLEAVENGLVEISRHNSYKTIYNELKDVEKWNSNKS